MILCLSSHAKALLASEGLAQGPHLAARVGFEPATLGARHQTPPLSHHAGLSHLNNDQLLNVSADAKHFY